MQILALINQMRPAIKKSAAKYSAISGIDIEDLEQEAIIGLMEMEYDPACGYRLITVALRAIDWHLLKRIKEIGPLIAVPRYFQERGGEVPRACPGDADEIFNKIEDQTLSALERIEAAEDYFKTRVSDPPVKWASCLHSPSSRSLPPALVKKGARSARRSCATQPATASARPAISRTQRARSS